MLLLEDTSPAFPVHKKYNVIYVDPPWHFSRPVYQDNGRRPRHLHEQYPTMSFEQLKSLPVNEIADKSCCLFLWTTDSHLESALALVKIWGFKYRTIGFVWKKISKHNKTQANVGAWTMKNCEICLLAVKGNMKQYKKANNVFQLIEEERTRHSQKPQQAVHRINALFPDVPKIELFSRRKQPGWDAWGNEVNEQTASPT